MQTAIDWTQRLTHIVLDHLPHAPLALAEDGEILFWSGAAATMFGFTAEEACGRNSLDLLVPPEHRDAAAHALNRAASMSEAVELAAIRRRRDGIVIAADIVYRGVAEACGQQRFVVASLQDITRIKARRESELIEAKFGGLLESAPEAMLIVNCEGRIILANTQTEQVFGYQREELLGEPIELLMPIRYWLGHLQFRPSPMARPLGRTTTPGPEVFGARKDGSEFPVEMSLRPLVTEEGSLTLTTIRDLTERKRVEHELVAARKTAEDASRLKSEFLAGMSHELRTPLNGIIGFSELLFDGRLGPLDPEHREYVGHILTSSRHLLRLVNEVLDIAKIEAGQMPFLRELVDPAALAFEVRDILYAMAAEKRLDVQVDSDPELGQIISDGAKLKQVLYNYLSNAIKFTPHGGTIWVRLQREGAHEFRISVEDTGVGVSSDDLGRLFVEFQQLDVTASAAQPGTGLGLALTKRIVEAQGGSVGIESELGRGSLFSATLPLIYPPWRLDGSLGKSVLVIADDVERQAILEKTLSDGGFVAVSAGTLADATARCRVQQFDVIAFDLGLRQALGADLLREIRLTGPNAQSLFVIVSVADDGADVLGIQVDGWLTKRAIDRDVLCELNRLGVSPRRTASILVVDNSRAHLKRMERLLSALGYRPLCVRSIDAGLAVVGSVRPAAIVIDPATLGTDGPGLLDQLRALPRRHPTPIIAWTGKRISRPQSGPSI